MKKFFALVLALAMVMSMASVAMAANEAKVTLSGIHFDYDADDDAMNLGAALEYGDTAYYCLKIEGEMVSDYALVEKLKVKAEFELGEELVESVSLVKKYVNWAKSEGGYSNNPADYYYFIAVKTAYKEGVVDADIVGTLEFNRKDIDKDDAPANLVKESMLYEIDDCEVDIEFNVFYDNNWLGDAEKYLVDGKDIVIKYDGEYALKFDSDEEVEITFGKSGEENEGTFTVDASGQGKVFVKYNTKADEAIVAANPGVKMFFVNFNNVKFNRTGEFVYEMEDGVAAYKVVDGALVEIPGLEIDDGEFSFNTRVLESYVFADAELVNPVVEAPVVAPEVTNPTTGA